LTNRRAASTSVRAWRSTRRSASAAGGAGVILISSDLPELIGMCDRILVMHHGRISGEVERESFSEERILAYAAGVDPGS